MSLPSVKGYMPLCVTLRSQVCDEQGVGQWPMWKRYDSVKGIVDQYVDEPYREFFALPYYEVDRQKSEEYFYWFTPRSESTFTRLNKMGDDYDYYKGLLDETIAHYRSVIEQLKGEGKSEEANFLQLSLKYAGDFESNVYCGDGRVVATVWGMRPREGQDLGESIIFADLFPEKEIHTVEFDLGSHGTTDRPTMLKKSHGTKIFAHQVPLVKAKDGCEFISWNRNPMGVEVTSDLLFVAQYREPLDEEKPKEEIFEGEKPKEDLKTTHHVRFLSPDGKVMTELDVEHGKQMSPGFIPQLPVVDGLVCPAWDGNPLNDVINANRDYKAIAPNAPDVPEKQVHTVRFLMPDGQALTQFQVEHGTQLTSAQVPPLPVVDGDTCPGWSSDPLAEKIMADRDFIAKMPEKKEPVIVGRGGFWRALLNWMLLALGLLLLFLLLWLFLLGKGNFDFCGCGCTDPIERPHPTPSPSPGPVPPPVRKPCDEMQTSGSYTPESFIFDMGQESGSFLFEYATGAVYPDKIVIYDGENSRGKEIFRYYGVTGDGGWASHLVSPVDFHKSKIYIEVIPHSDTGTYWEIKANCPNN